MSLINSKAGELEGQHASRMDSLTLSYIENTEWEKFLEHFGDYFETEFDTILTKIMGNDITIGKFTIMYVEKALEKNYKSQYLLDTFIETCIKNPRYIMQIYEALEMIIDMLIEKGAVVSPTSILEPIYPYGSVTLEDESRSLQVRGFFYRVFLQNSHKIEVDPVYWEDREYTVRSTKENFLSAIFYEAENLWMFKL
jgi:hypothetical protein